MAADVSMSSINSFLENADTNLECHQSFCFILARLSFSNKLLKLLFLVKINSRKQNGHSRRWYTRGWVGDEVDDKNDLDEDASRHTVSESALLLLGTNNLTLRLTPTRTSSTTLLSLDGGDEARHSFLGSPTTFL